MQRNKQFISVLLAILALTFFVRSHEKDLLPPIGGQTSLALLTSLFELEFSSPFA